MESDSDRRSGIFISRLMYQLSKVFSCLSELRPFLTKTPKGPICVTALSAVSFNFYLSLGYRFEIVDIHNVGC